MERQQRKLAAILAADVAGYSRLMAADETGTLARFNALRAELLDPKIAQFKGRVVGSAGDSLLVEFGSAVDAVQCAVEAQERLAARDGDLPEDRRMAFRMGINLGDVIAEAGTIHGDGVNVAARLERLGEPGTVVVSRSIHDQVKGKLPYEFADLGEHTVKNIAEPVRAYRVGRAAEPRPAGPRQAVDLALPSKPSVAVLPFTNMSGDADQEYFSDGLTEDIITELSRFRELFVTARNSSFAFKGKAVRVDEIARALGVAYVVEGSVRKAGNRVRVTAQLIEAATVSHLWADRYDRDLEDIFTIQDEITRTVVAALPARIEADRLRAARRKPTTSMDAYDFYLRGKELTAQFRDRDLPDEIAHYERAVTLDPRFARPHAWLSFARLRRFWQTFEAGDLGAASVASQRAVDLDGEDGVCHGWHGFVLLFERKHAQARRHLDLALALNPNDADIHAVMALILHYTGHAEEAIERLGRAMRFNPLHPTWYWEVLGIAHMSLRRYDEALKAFAMIEHPAAYIHAHSACCLTALGRNDEARAARARLFEASPGYRFVKAMTIEAWENEADLNHLRGLCSAAGIPE